MYHSHQNSADQIDKGLYGTLIVEPKNPAEVTDKLLVIAPGERYDVEFTAGNSSFVIDDHNDSKASADIRIPSGGFEGSYR